MSSSVKTISVQRWYLEMHENLGREMSHPVPEIRVVRMPVPSTDYYRTLYNAVGESWKWIDRNLLDDDELQKIIHDELVEIYVLRVDGEPAGYGELDRRQLEGRPLKGHQPGEIELAYFGVIERFHRRGLGKYLLNWLILRAWAYEPSRLWLHTCELDHPAALPLYTSSGFKIFDERQIEQVVE